MSKAKLAIALSTLSVAIVAWAVPIKGIAHQRVADSTAEPRDVVAPIRLRDERERGLLAQRLDKRRGSVHLRRSTPERVFRSSAGTSSSERDFSVTKSRRPLVGGLSTSPIASDQEAQISGLALGTREQSDVPGSFTAAVVTNLPGSIDGILDPTEVFSPFGYSVDLPNRELRVFDTAAHRCD